jgi:hypothetical protein
VEERLLLDRVDVHRTGEAVDEGVVGAAPVFTHTTRASLGIGDLASTRAELTLHPPFRQSLEP